MLDELAQPTVYPSKVKESESVDEKVQQNDTDVALLNEFKPLDQLIIKQKSKLNCIPFIRRRKNKYVVETRDKDPLFTIEEDNSWWGTYLLYRLRPCQLRVYDRNAVEVIRINRPFAFTPRLFPCQMQHVAVFSPPTQLIGTIEQQWSPVRPLYKARDHNGLDIFYVRGPVLTMSNILEDVEFSVSDCSGARAALVCKKSKGIEGVLFAPYPHRYSITLSTSAMPVQHKAILVAMTLLLDYMYYD